MQPSVYWYIPVETNRFASYSLVPGTAYEYVHDDMSYYFESTGRPISTGRYPRRVFRLAFLFSRSLKNTSNLAS